MSYNDGDGEEKEKRSSAGNGGDAEQEAIARPPEGNRTEGGRGPVEGQAGEKTMNVDAHECRICGATLPNRRRRGSPKTYCSARCRKAAWLKAQSVPPKVGHVAHKRERLGRSSDRAGEAVGVSGRMIRRTQELWCLVRELWGDDKVLELQRDTLAGRTAPISSMLRAAKAVKRRLESQAIQRTLAKKAKKKG